MSLAPVKSRLVLPLWYRLTWVVPEKGPLNVCVRVYVPGDIQDTFFQIQEDFLRDKPYNIEMRVKFVMSTNEHNAHHYAIQPTY